MNLTIPKPIIQEKNIVELFEEQAEKRPGYKAVVLKTSILRIKI